MSASFHRSLPHSPDLDHLRDEAKSLKKRCASGDPAAIEFIAFHRGVSAPSAKLADVQFALARSYGFKSWPRLKSFVEAQSLTPVQRGELLLRTLFTDNHSLLAELYERRTSLPVSDFFLATALGDVDTVQSMLAGEPTLASRVGGPMQTQAITYAAYARLARFDDTYPARQQHIVKLLLTNGADPNSSTREEARGKQGNGRLSTLYACCRQPGNPQLAELLLKAGADTDDGESLYHASELVDTRCLELLFAAGVPKTAQEYCIVRALDHENPRAVEVYMKYGTDPNHLDWALFRQRSLAVIGILIDHGADPNAPCKEHWLLKRIEGLTPLQIAERSGATDTVAYLLSRGAIDNRTPKDRLLGACARVDEAAMRTIMAAHPDVSATLNERDHGNLATFARDGRLETVRLMLDAGFDIEARSDDLDATALLYAATTGDVAMVDLLVRRGARLDVKHKYDGTPLDTTIYSAAFFRSERGRYAETAQRLIEAGERVTDDFLRFAVENDLDDIAEVLKANGATL
jgi:ankyrin repeat protein